MNRQDEASFAQLLQEVCEIYSKPYSDVLLSAYYRVLRPQSFDAISRGVLRILSDASRRQVMPTAAEIKAIAQHMEGTTDEQTYLPCQQHGCEALVAWPPTGAVTEHSYYCPRHKPAHHPEWTPAQHEANRVTPEEKRALFQQATPQAKAFLRSIDALAHQMHDIPITEEERAAAEEQALVRRPRAFEGKAEGPGVHASLFLHNRPLGVDLPADYRERREIVAAAGWKFVVAEGVWRRGRYDREQERWRYGTRAITDEEIDRCLDLTAVAEFARRR